MTSKGKRDCYEVLGISQNATPDEIKKAYRKLAVQYHPDKHRGESASEEKFKEVSEAYEILRDPEKRAAFDRFGHGAFGPGSRGGFGGFHNPEDIFREVFGGGGGIGGIFEQLFGGGGRADPSGPAAGGDLRYNLKITFEEAFSGAEKEISFHKLDACSSCSGSGSAPGSSTKTCSTCRGQGQVTATRGFFAIRQTCPTCRGSGTIIEKPCQNCRGEGRVETKTSVKARIPPGVDDGTRLRSSGGGEGGLRGGPSGDLYIVIHVEQHEIFAREGDDLFCEVPITFAMAALGGEMEVPTPTGKEKKKIPAGTQPGTLFRLKGKGMPHVSGRGNGDLIVRALVEVPAHLNTEQRKKLQEFAELCDENTTPLRKSFLDKAKGFFK
jgi:molecular chaperone DnaJ